MNTKSTKKELPFSAIEHQIQPDILNNTPEIVTPIEAPDQLAKKEQKSEHLPIDEIITPTPQQKQVIIPNIKDPVASQIEKIMESGLVDAFKEMTPIQQQEFKIKGEKTAFAIKELLNKSKVNIKKIFLLLFDWLKIIPGISRFYIQQEAKIKADKIVAINLHQNIKP